MVRLQMEIDDRMAGGANEIPSPLTLEEQQDLVLRYTPLVRRVARSLPLEIPGVLEFEDAVGYGTCGLIEAVRRYDPAKGTNFHAYAVRRIRGAMIDAFRRMDRLSRTMRQKARDVQRAQGELEAELGRTPSEPEAADYLGISLEEYREAVSNGRWITVSLDRLLERDQENDTSYPAAEMPADQDEVDFTRNLDDRETLEDLATAVQLLPERERLVISLYYVERLTMRDIAEILNVSETRVSQLHAQAVRRLRAAMLRIAA